MQFFRNSIVAIISGLTAVTTAHAGGFSTEGVNPGGALFNDKRFVLQGAFLYAMPERRYSDTTGTQGAGGGGAATGASSTNAADNFTLLSGDLKYRVNDEFDCAVRGHQPYSADSPISASNWIGRYVRTSEEIKSFGLDGTCAFKIQLSDQYRMRLIGGIRSTDIEYTRSNLLAHLGGAENIYSMDADRGFGYRVGAAFEMPEYALRAQVIYDSEIDLSLAGSQTVAGVVAGGPVTTDITMPQSISARFQSGINQTTLIYAGVRWMEWSVLDTITVVGGGAGAGVGVDLNNGFENGWTVDAGVQKKLTDDLSGSLGITWNQGIGGGYTDTWSFTGGVAYDIDDYWRISLGASATLLTSGTHTSTLATTGATTTYKQADDWAYGVGVRLQYALD